MSSQFDRLYYQDCYQTTFTATVIRCRAENDVFFVELDQTAFYPEGGGQPADTGFLGEARVIDVHDVHGVVIHTTTTSLREGEVVTGRINWDRRFTLMQQHSGEHILSGLINRLFGHQNVGFHIGVEDMTIDFSGELNDEALEKIENLANQAVFENRPIQVCYPTADERQQLDYRSKIELGDDVRVVVVPEADQCACCGLHVARTGEIGLIKILSRQKYKGGIRLSVVCGHRALVDYSRKNKQINTLSTMLSRKPDDILAGVDLLQMTLSSLKAEYALLKSQLLEQKVEALTQSIGPSAEEKSRGRLCLFEDNLTPDDLRSLCMRLVERTGMVIAIFSGSDHDRFRYAVASRTEDMKKFGKKMNEALDGRGGGTPRLIQGTVSATREDIRIWFSGNQIA